MVYITKKKIKGKIYLYLEESGRIDGKRTRLWQKYLGPEDSLKDMKITSLFSKNAQNVQIHTMDFGISASLWQIAKEIGLVEIINRNTTKNREQGLSLGEYILIAAINRCSEPSSKSKLAKWFEHDWISTQFVIESNNLNAQTYWNHFQYLNKEIMNNIEVDINKSVLDHWNLKLDSLFYDPTNFYTFSKNSQDESLLQFGHSKENRNGNKLINYTLLCARESGTPIMHETYAGNIQDSNKFKETPNYIEKRLKSLGYLPENITLVFDKGNHSKIAFDAIDHAGFGFIVSARNSTQKKLLHQPLETFSDLLLTKTNTRVKYFKTKRVIYGKGRDVYVVFDPKKYKKHKIKFMDNLQERVDDINEFFKCRLNVKKWRSKEAVKKKIQSLIGRNPFKSVINYFLDGEDEHLTLKIKIDSDSRENHIETLGRTILFTNRTSFSPEDIIWGYREQYIVEHAFRYMKSPTSIAIRPMYHHSDRSIRAHVFICVLSLLLLSLLRLKLSRTSINLSYEELLSELRRIHLLEIITSSKGKSLWKMDAPPDSAKNIIKILKLKSYVEDLS